MHLRGTPFAGSRTEKRVVVVASLLTILLDHNGRMTPFSENLN